MSLKVVCFCSYLATINLPWRQEDWGAYKFVHALKGHELNGYCHVPVDGILRRLSSQNLNAAIDWYAKFALAYLTKKKISTSFVAVPVPNSDCTVRSGTKPHTLRLAKTLGELVDAETAVMDCLRWKRNLGSASQESGPRDAGTLQKPRVQRQTERACLRDSCGRCNDRRRTPASVRGQASRGGCSRTKGILWRENHSRTGPSSLRTCGRNTAGF